jgi:acyl-CoA synthetase (AMP-forming)/AMP-acid ligase II
MTAESADFNYAALCDRWYAEAWYSARTCIDAFQHAAVEHAQTLVVFVAEGTETTATVSRMHCAERAIAAGIQRLGIRRGDAAAVQLTNRIECAVAYQAVLLGGAVLVPVVHLYGPVK